MTAEHPDLIDLDTGAWYEWVEEPNGCDHSGYALVDDHDCTWPRDALDENGTRVVEASTVDPVEFRRLRDLFDNPVR
ncbi:MAG: hypothetical protein QOF58_5646 [Pseudonocardiales bacterium]|nr:hypothetical protein [Pseudonocardiales bacterium]